MIPFNWLQWNATYWSIASLVAIPSSWAPLVAAEGEPVKKTVTITHSTPTLDVMVVEVVVGSHTHSSGETETILEHVITDFVRDHIPDSSLGCS